jgi:small subunit ribosomal protein S1
MPEERRPKKTVPKSKAKGGEKKPAPLKKAAPVKKEIPQKAERPAPPPKEEKVIRRRVTIAEKKAFEEKKEPEVKKIEKAVVAPVLPVEPLKLEDEYSKEKFDELLKMYDSTLKDIEEGEIVKGRVIGVTKEDVIVDVGFKSEGIIPLSEFPEPVNIKLGDEIEVYLEAIENQDGQLVLSKQKADFLRVWDNIKEAYDKGALVKGKIVRRIKGGMVVDLYGVDAFLPGSQIALKQVPNFDELVTQTMELKIIKLNKIRRNIVVSRRAVLEDEREKQKSKLLTEIEPAQVREAVVKNITDFGVFLDLGGVDGLLHITDMSWGRISHPSEMVKLGDKINVKVLDFDKNTGRVSLGLKQMTPYPWENIEQKYPIGKKVRGKVVSLTDYGAFVELERGVEGLIHISEMSWTQHIKHPSRIMAISDVIDAVVLSVDKENEKISLGIKQMEPDPWENLDKKYPKNTRVFVKVRNLTAFGAFVELEEGIDGLIHISDLSWTKRIQHPGEILKKGEKIEVVVLGIDKENRRISLGYKQLSEDPWPKLQKKYSVGQETSGKIIRLLDRGAVVDLNGEAEGFVPTNHLGKPDITKPAEAFSEGDEIPLQVIEFDHYGKKIVLSVNAYYENREKGELEDYLTKHPTKTLKMEEVIGEKPKELETLSEPYADVNVPELPQSEASEKTDSVPPDSEPKESNS